MKPLAKALLARFGSIGRVLTADPAALRQVPGMGDAAIATLKIVTKAAERLAREEAMAGDVISSWDKLLERKSVVSGKSVAVPVDRGGRGTIKKNIGHSHAEPTYTHCDKRH